jgi:hypothetical protein
VLPTHQLFNDLISPREERGRHIDPERLGGRHVDHQLVARRCLHWEVGGLLAFEEAINIAGRLPERVDRIGTIGHSGAMIRDIGPELSLCWPVLPMRLREDAQAQSNFFGGPP